MPPSSKPTRKNNTTSSSAKGRELLAELGSSTMAQTEFYSPVPKGYVRGEHKYVVILGTVMSGLGKGVFSSSMAKMLKDKGLSVAPIKMEGYFNIDAGTLNPFRHGEVFVLDDGTECDMDLGTYERLLDQDLSRQNFITSGQLFSAILKRERRGGYLGRDVQVIPHVTGEVKRKLRELALTGGPDGGPADVVFIEVGGTVGDYENGYYIEAVRELAFEEGEDSVCFVALTYVIEPPVLGEQKSKAAQLGIRALMETGIQPHIIACRSSSPVTSTVKQKIAMYSNVPLERVFSMHDRESIYTIPDDMRIAGLDREVLTVLNLHRRVNAAREDKARDVWRGFVRKLTARHRHRVNIAITGKYMDVRDAYASISKALSHCGVHLDADIDLRWIETSDLSPENIAEHLRDVHGVITPGGFGVRGVEGKIACVRYCRENGIPYLGICLGFQTAVIEFARNVLGLTGAGSTEFDPDCDEPVISELPEQKEIEGLGGSMRLGAQDVQILPGSLAWKLYGRKDRVRERFRHRYEVDPRYIEALEKGGLVFSGRHPEHPIMQILELPPEKHPYLVATQFHPELTSRPLSPQPLFMGLVAAAIRFAEPDFEPGTIEDRWLSETQHVTG